jgi:hypothetical protein
MNEHLEPVFNTWLPVLEKQGIDYWVYGGVSIAAYAEKFVRQDKEGNKDVDIFVKYDDFHKARVILDDFCKRNALIFKYDELKDGSKRPKVEIRNRTKGKLSMIPIYQKNNNMVELIHPHKTRDQYPDQILERIEKSISDFRFFTPPRKYIRDMFLNYIIARNRQKTSEKIDKDDAKAILSTEELSEYGFE